MLLTLFTQMLGLFFVLHSSFTFVYICVALTELLICPFIRQKELRAVVVRSELAANTPPCWSARASGQSVSVWSGGGLTCVLVGWHLAFSVGSFYNFCRFLHFTSPTFKDLKERLQNPFARLYNRPLMFNISALYTQIQLHVSKTQLLNTTSEVFELILCGDRLSRFFSEGTNFS